ncbi:MAG: hypothetical protein HDT43_04620 [Ruminococcaceae bacterium]|nr:hypothetical protein [Oscillospiraceae bacterium]
MKIRCKHCSRKISITDYSCPVCGTVNFATDGEVQIAYNKNKSRNSIITLVVILIVHIVLIGGIALAIYLSVTSYNNEQREIAMRSLGYSAVNEQCGNKFPIVKFEFEKGTLFSTPPPFDEFYVNYVGEPENFIADSISFCELLRISAKNNTAFSVTIKCGENGFSYNFQNNIAQTNMLFDYSELEKLNGIKQLCVYSGSMTEEEIENAKDNSYSFDVDFMEK